MMQCPQCATENRLGAIFCRSCGAKLQLDTVTSETFEEVTGVVAKDKVDAKKRVRKIIFNALRLVFLAVVVYGFYLALQLPDVQRPATTGKLDAQFKAMRRELLAGIAAKKTVTKKTTEQALNSYLAARLALTKSKEKTFRLLDSWVSIEDDGQLAWVFDVKLFGRMLRMQYLGTVEIKDGKVTFVPKGFFSARMGKLPLPTLFMKRWTKNLWASILEKDDVNQDLLDGISDLKFDGDEITVTVGG